MKTLYALVVRYPKTAIAFVAVVIRLLFSYAFYGSIDVSSFIGMNGHTFNQTLVQHPVVIWCIFPVLPFYLWLSGWLSVMTPLPIAFCFKIVPIVFDGLLALMLYDIVTVLRPAHARAVGFLYALCPVSLIITCIHGQWDVLPLFCLVSALYVRTCFSQTRLNQVLYGALFACAFLLKPLPVILFPFFFMPIRGYVTKLKSYVTAHLFMILGLLGMVALCFACFIWYGLNIITIIDKILRYFNKGQATLGLPLAYPFNVGILALLLKNRLWMMSLIACIAWLYHTNKIDVYASILLSLLSVYSFGMVNPQYFLWALPFFLITGYYRLFVGYTFLITILCILYYMNPLSNPVVPYQSMLSFATLRGWEWFMPPAWLTSEQLVPLIRILGNYGIPFFCMGSVVYIVVSTRAQILRDAHDVGSSGRAQERFLISARGEELRSSVSNHLSAPAIIPYLAVPFGLTVLIATLMLVFNTASLAPAYNIVVEQRFDCYATRMIDGHWSGAYESSTLCNGAYLLVALLLGWCWYAGISLYRKKQ